MAGAGAIPGVSSTMPSAVAKVAAAGTKAASRGLQPSAAQRGSAKTCGVNRPGRIVTRVGCANVE